MMLSLRRVGLLLAAGGEGRDDHRELSLETERQVEDGAQTGWD